MPCGGFGAVVGGLWRRFCILVGMMIVPRSAVNGMMAAAGVANVATGVAAVAMCNGEANQALDVESRRLYGHHD